MVKPKTVNLIPGELLRKPLLARIRASYVRSRSIRVFTAAAAAFVLVHAAQVATLGVFRWRLAVSKNAAQEAKVRLSQLQSKYMRIEKTKSELIKEKETKIKRLELLLSTSSENKRYSGLLGVIADLAPQDVWITRLALSEDEIQITGSTLNNQLINQLIARLDGSGSFRNSRFVSSEKQVRESHAIFNFQITAEPVWTVKDANPR